MTYSAMQKANGVDRVTTPVMVVVNLVGSGAAWVVTYTDLPAEPAIILAVLMAIDFSAGIAKSRAIGECITSHRMRIGVMSKCGVLILPLVIALAAKGLGADFMWLVNWSISLFILSELYSIVANVYTARTGIEAPEWNAIEILMNKIKFILEALDKRGG